MDNLTNQVLKLDNGNNYFVLRQASYKGKTYFFCAGVSEDEEDFTNDFIFLEKIDDNGTTIVKVVKDKEILDVLAKNIRFE